MTGDVRLRAARPSDAAALAAVFRAACQHGYRGIVADEHLDAQDLGKLTTWFATLLATGDFATVVAETASGEVGGFARFGADPARPAARDRGYLASLYVRPETAGVGVGRALLAESLAQLSAAGRVDVTLTVLRDNPPARRLYERAGFRAAGSTTTDDFWHVAVLPLRRRPTNVAVPLPALPAVGFAPIRELSWRPVRRPLRATFRTALREVGELSGWALAVRTADGTVGTGTTVATPQITGDDDARIVADLAGPLLTALLGGTDLETALRAIQAAPAGPAARAAADMALHDLALHQLAGPDPALPGFPVPGSALPDSPLPDSDLRALDAAQPGPSLARLLAPETAGTPPISDITIALDRPESMADAARARLAGGFRTLKLKLGNPDSDAARVLAVWAAIQRHVDDGGNPVALRVDANQAWSADEALRVLGTLAAAGVDLQLVEQPVAAADLDGMARVRVEGGVPVLADESVFTAGDVRRIADAGAADLVNLKLLKTGGLWPARAVVAACRDTGLGLLIGCMLEPAEGVAAASALAAVGSEGPLAHDLDAGWWAAPAAS